ncbi:LysR family transcriptional regulator [Liquorilactobacillus nagelii]|uniref:LysR family transcriptional regulator n=1 Tax=Liquorilactobacillus nagelii TaxID=82688 RepID=UPI0039E9F103
MNIDHLRAFVSSAETLNFSTSAKTLHISQSAVSQNIKSLENELGFLLFRRTKRKVVLTKSGELFYVRIKNILINLDKTIAQCRETYQREVNQLTLGATGTSFEANMLPLIIKKYQSKRSNLKIYLENFNHTLLKQHLYNQENDIIFTTEDDVKNDAKLEFIPLIKGHFCALIPLNNHLNDLSEIKLNDIKHQKLLLLNDAWCPPYQLALQNKIKNYCQLSNITYVNDVSIATTMVKAGLGITIIPDFISFPEKRFFSIIPLKESPNLTYGMVVLKNNNFQPAKSFIHWLVEGNYSKIIKILDNDLPSLK